MNVVKGYSIDFVNDGRLVIPKFVNNPIVPSVRRSSIEKGLQAECQLTTLELPLAPCPLESMGS